MSAPADFASIIEPVARELLGEPNAKLSNARQLRFGSNGSMAVHIDGDNRGTWRDHETEKGGGTLDLIVHAGKAASKGEAAQWCAERFPDAVAPARSGREIVATYRYVDERDRPVFEVVRFEPKDFRQRRPDPDRPGQYVWNLKGVTPLLYRLPEVIAAVARGERDFVVEGEKDADRLASLGVAATCNPGGAGKWTAALSGWLRGARVAIVPDNDDAGRDHAESVARSLKDVAAQVRVVELELDERKADVSDWLTRGHLVDRLSELADDAPDWRPTYRPRFSNLVWFGQEDSAPPMSWLVRGVLVEGGVSAVFGAPKSTKTFLALDLALHVAHGRNWYGQRTKGGGVVYVCGEGAAGARLRMKAWRQDRDGDDGAPFAMIPQSLNLFDDEDELARLVDEVNGLSGPMQGPVRLVILDTLARMLGPGDEDKARDINMFVRSAERIQRETGAHVMIVHHSGKDRDRGMRGSNALLGAVDVAIEVTKDDEGFCEAKVTAIKDGGDVGPFRYTLRQTVVGCDDDGEDIVSCVIVPADASQGARRKAPKLTPAELKALEQLRGALRDTGTFRDNVQIVPVGTWRDRVYSSHDGEHEAKKKHAQRVTKALIERGLVESDGAHAWLDEDAI